MVQIHKRPLFVFIFLSSLFSCKAQSFTSQDTPEKQPRRRIAIEENGNVSESGVPIDPFEPPRYPQVGLAYERMVLAEIDKCPPLPERNPPATLADLRPQDFKIVMAIGDSLYTGMNIRFSEYMDPTSTPIEHRGSSFAMGSDPDAISIPRFLSQHNRQLYGTSRGNSSWTYCYGPICPFGSPNYKPEPDAYGLNAAVSGSWSTPENLAKQLNYLDTYYNVFKPYFSAPISQLRISPQEPWKLLTVHIGLNNICAGGCTPMLSSLDANNYENHIRHLLQELQKRFRRVLVVLVGVNDLTKLKSVANKSPYCQTYRFLNALSCRCGDLSFAFSSYRTQIQQLTREYNQRLEEIALDYQSRQDSSDFGVLFDPGPTGINITGATMDLINSLDCLHPSKLSQSKMALGLWQNLFLPNEKKMAWDLVGFPQPFCPSMRDRIWYPQKQ